MAERTRSYRGKDLSLLTVLLQTKVLLSSLIWTSKTLTVTKSTILVCKNLQIKPEKTKTYKFLDTMEIR
jgi:hypothetical protein